MSRLARRGAVALLAFALLGAVGGLASCGDPNADALLDDPDAYGAPADEGGAPGDPPDIPYWHARDPGVDESQCYRCHPGQHDNRFDAPDGCLSCHRFQ